MLVNVGVRVTIDAILSIYHCCQVTTLILRLHRPIGVGTYTIMSLQFHYRYYDTRFTLLSIDVAINAIWCFGGCCTMTSKLVLLVVQVTSLCYRYRRCIVRYSRCLRHYRYYVVHATLLLINWRHCMYHLWCYIVRLTFLHIVIGVVSLSTLDCPSGIATH